MKKQSVVVFLSLLASMNIYTQEREKLLALRDSIKSIFEEKHIPGAFVTVVSKDSVLFQEGFGYTNLDSKVSTTQTHLFKIGSVSKTFTAIAVLKLIEEGKLNLEDKLFEIAPEIPFKNKWRKKKPVRLKHLLEHKAGFDDMPISVLANERGPGMTAFDEVVLNKNALKSRWPPGLGHSYSNPGYVILGYLIEKKSGKRYQKYITDEILRPLRLSNTIFKSDANEPVSAKDYALGYWYSNKKFSKTRDVRIIGESAGALLSNASDMSHFLRFMLNKKLWDSLNVISPSSVNEMELFHGDLEMENNITNGYGLGIYTRTFGSKNVPFLGHSGGIDGFVSDFIYNRELDIGIAVSNNGERGNGRILDVLVDFFVKDYSVKGSSNENGLSPFKDWEGVYRVLTTRNQIFDFVQFPLETVKIEISNDSLYLTRFLQDREAFTRQEGIAFAKENNIRSSLFLTEKEGEKYINYNMDTLIPVNGLFIWGLRIAILLGILTGIITCLTFIFSLIASLFQKKLRPFAKRMLMASLPFLILFTSIILFFSNATLENLVVLGKLNTVTVFIFALTTLFPIAALWSTLKLYKKSVNAPRNISKIFYGSIVFSSIFLSLYCIYFGWFMKQLWP